MSGLPKSVAIKDFSTSDYVRDKLQQLDTNGDSNLVTAEVADADGYLLCNEVVGSWDSATKRGVEGTLFDQGLLSKMREALCPTPKAVVEEKVSGNAATGHVFHFAQRHQLASAPSRRANLSDTYRTDVPQSHLDTVATFQFDMLRKLLEMGPKHVFDESLAEELDPTFWRSVPISVNKTRKVFSQGQLGETPTTEQLQYLVENGAATVYAQLRDDVHLHATANDAIRGQLGPIFEKLNRGEGLNADERTLVHTHREKTAVKLIMDFLKNNPGQDIALIYGRAHNFTPHFTDETNGPKFSTVTFPDALNKSNNVLGK